MTDSISGQPPVLFEVLDTANGAFIGVATLNAPQVLNGLSLEMVDLLAAQMSEWAGDPRVAVVVLRAVGEKAFCAGGDLHGLYASARATPRGQPWANEGARRFFENEYRLDYRIHHYPKPILCWGHGIVMGGGMGLMMGASHRVVTEASRLAMPEISIGLFPDVGGSWLLGRMPGRLGLFLGLTAAPVNASDALFVHWADFALPHAEYGNVLKALRQADWVTSSAQQDAQAGRGQRGANDAMLSDILQRRALPAQPEGPLAQHASQINAWCAGDDLARIGEQIAALNGHDDPWLSRAGATYVKGAPGSARLAYEFGQRARVMSLADVFRMEYIGVLAALAYGDVTEGIRALLIDKDKSPEWNPATLEQADAQWVAKFFEAPWPTGTTHPLADMGVDAPPS